ncbi:MAG: hypothetical protein JO328_19030 [Hyphomicrobiales bacterium]|nr:hypothetical protein [Hyphomicrobiales bacterium]MBV9426338.1 hypothetical protein [Bradyrhizobiaceae bacterium]
MNETADTAAFTASVTPEPARRGIAKLPAAMRAPRFAVFASGAAVMFLVSFIGWVRPPQPTPFDDPPAPLSAAWWIRASVDPGIAELDIVPVGRFGSFLPRAIARSIRAHTTAGLDDIADSYMRPDGREIGVTFYPASASRAGGVFLYSADAGATWRSRDFKSRPCGAPGDALKIQGFDRGGENARLDCFPREIPNLGAAIARTGIPFGNETDVYLADPTPKERSGQIVINSRFGFGTLGQPGPGPYTIVEALDENRAVVASGDRFAILTLTLGSSGTDQSRPAVAQETTPADRSGKIVASAGMGRLQAALSEATRFEDSFPVGISPAIRTIRMSRDGKSIVVAQEVAPRTGVLVSQDSGHNWAHLAYATGAPPWVFVALTLTLFFATAAARELIRAPVGEASIADEAATDRPIGLNDADALQFGQIANGLLMFLRNPNTEPPVTIAVSGAWGSGKTSLMTILRDLLREHDGRPVWFNAWHHQKEEHLLAALLENIRRQSIPPVRTWAGLSFRVRLMRRRLAGRVGVLLLALAVMGTTMGYVLATKETRDHVQAFLIHLAEETGKLAKRDGDRVAPVDPNTKSAPSVAPDGKQQNDRKDETDWWHALLALVPLGSIPGLLFSLVKNLQAFPRAKPKQLLASGSKLSFRYRFAQEFAETTSALRSGQSPGLVVFIDDLDRCHAKSVVEILEAINFIVSAGECFVIFGIDKDQVRRSILANYKSEFMDIPEEAVRGRNLQAARQRFADRYLEKIINIEVPVPLATDSQIEALLTGTAAPPKLPRGVALRQRFRLVYENGPVLVALGLIVALFLWIGPYLDGVPVPPHLDPSVVSPPGSVTSPAFQGSTGFTVGYAPQQDAVAAAPPARFPWPQAVFVIGLGLAAGAYLARLAILVEQRPVTDSVPFRDALKLWSPVVFRISRTPRRVKQYKNMLRYQAMRLRGGVPRDSTGLKIGESDLVALGAIWLADRDLLPKALASHQPVNSLIKDAAAGAAADQQTVFRQISAILDQGDRGAGGPSVRLGDSIEPYLALLPPTS